MTIITLLNNEESNSFDLPPHFTEEERKQYFILPDPDEIEFRKIYTKIGYILQQGYFLSKNKFFLTEQFHESDIEYITKLCGVEIKIEFQINYSLAISNVHKQLILEKYNYKSFPKYRHLLKKEALELVKSTLKPKEIFYELVSFLDEIKIERPRYYVFAEVITNSLNLFEKNLIQTIDENLTLNQKKILDNFMKLPLKLDENLSAKNPYLITYLKKVLQATTPGKIKQSLTDFSIIKNLHEILYEFFKSDLLSQELINYYAVWVIKAEHIQFEYIQDKRNKRLYVVSFISYQYKIRQDYFVDTFLQLTQKYYNDAEKSIAQNLLNKDFKYEKQEQLIKIRNILSGSKEQLEEIKKIVFSNSYHDSIKVEEIKDILSDRKSNFHETILQELDKLENSGIKNIKEQLFYDELSKNYRKLHNRVGGILQILEFNPQTSNSEIYQAVYYYQQKNGKLGGRVPKEFLSKAEQKKLYFENGEFNFNLYKVFLFKEIAHHIKAGSLNLLFSERYKSIDDYLINWERWKELKDELLSRAGLNKLKNPESLIYLKNNLHEQYKITNENSGNNPYLKFNLKGNTRVSTPKSSEEIDKEDIILKFIDKNQFIPLVDILSNIQYSIDYTSSFSHYTMKNSKSTPSEETIYAAVIALGCNIGIRKMGNISQGVGADKLEYIVRWFFNKKNLDEANQKLISFINSLPLSIIYLEDKEKLNTSSDGQKFNVSVPSLHASHSSKYFGTGKGVSVYSFIDEKGRLFYNTVINASERESNYVLDGLFHNEDIKSDTHSTDTHGYSEIIFGICNSLGIDFTPRIKNYQDQLLYTCKEKSRAYYEKLEYKILPSKSMYINEKIIIEQWEYILRFLCSIKLKETLPSNILKRLSSYSKQHPLYRAIKEVGKIYKTIFLLRYYNDLPLRQNIEKQLNKIELSHLFAKAVFFGNNQEFRQATKEDQELAVGCRHLIQNAIILWNYLFISEKLSLIKDEQELKQQINLLKNSSMMSWQHINMHGIYDFTIETTQSPFDMMKIKLLKIN